MDEYQEGLTNQIKASKRRKANDIGDYCGLDGAKIMSAGNQTKLAVKSSVGRGSELLQDPKLNQDGKTARATQRNDLQPVQVVIK
jgi:hypothetical protein